LPEREVLKVLRWPRQTGGRVHGQGGPRRLGAPRAGREAEHGKREEILLLVIQKQGKRKRGLELVQNRKTRLGKEDLVRGKEPAPQSLGPSPKPANWGWEISERGVVDRVDSIFISAKNRNGKRQYKDLKNGVKVGLCSHICRATLCLAQKRKEREKTVASTKYCQKGGGGRSHWPPKKKTFRCSK